MPHSFDRQLQEFEAAARAHIQALQIPGTPQVLLRQIAASLAWESTERSRLERDAAEYRLQFEQVSLAWHGTLTEADPTPSHPTFGKRHAAVLLLLAATATIGYELASLRLQLPPLQAGLAGAVATLVLFFPMWVGAGQLVPEETGKPQVKARHLRALFCYTLIAWVSTLLAYLMRWAAYGRSAATDLPAELLLITLLILSPALASVIAEQIVVLSWANTVAKRWAACAYGIAVCDRVRTLAVAVERGLPATAPAETPKPVRYRAL